MSRSRSRLAADWFAKLRVNAETNEVENTDITSVGDSLSAVASSGSYSDLTGTPAPFDPSTLAAIAVSGSASDLTGALPAIDGSALTNLGDTLIGLYNSSTTVSLEAGTYLLVAAGGGGGSHYQSSAGDGGNSTIVLGDVTAFGKGGSAGASSHHTGGSAGGRGGKGHNPSEDYLGGFYARTPVLIHPKTGGIGLPGNYGAAAGWSLTDVIKTITSTTTATITVGAGGSSGGNQTYASPGESGFCAIWKI